MAGVFPVLRPCPLLESMPPVSFAARAAARARRWSRRLLLATAATGIALAAYFQLPAVAYYWAQTHQQAEAHRPLSLWLPDYQAAVQARPVEGLRKNLSGLTYSSHTGTLFATTNSPAQVAELSTDGQVLRTMPIHGARDTEDITHIEGERFVLSDERNNTVYTVDIGPETREVHAREPLALPLESLHENLGVEALFWDAGRQRLFVGQEKWPLRLLGIGGAEGTAPSGLTPPSRLAVQEWNSQGLGSLFINDLAAVSSHGPSGNLLLLSEESAMVVEYTPQGRPVSLLPLWGGLHGLERKIPQPEGMALAPDGRLFIVSEPNLFYRFEKPAAARPSSTEPV